MLLFNSHPYDKMQNYEVEVLNGKINTISLKYHAQELIFIFTST